MEMLFSLLPLVPILSVAELEILDSTELNPINDADFALDSGEIAELIITIENQGA